MPSRNGKDWKAVQLPYAKIAAYSGTEKKVYCLSERTVAMLLAQTPYLYWASRWANADQFTDEQKREIRQWAAQAETELFPDGCGGDVRCIEHPASSQVFTYAPANPFVDPEEIPEGYVAEPFRIVTGDDIGDQLLQLQAGDVMAVSPPVAAGIDFPRFRVTFEIATQVELHLLSYPTGGLALITIDDDPLSGEVIDLTRDLTSLPPETEPVVIVERNFADVLHHHIDVTFLPTIADELPPVLFGGGLRKAVICAPSVGGGEDCLFEDVWQDQESPCQLWKRVDGVESQFANLRLCTPLIRQGPGGVEVSDDGGETWTPVDVAPPAARDAQSENNRCLAAANAVNVFVSLHYEVCNNVALPGITVVSLAAAVVGFIILILGGFVAATFFIGLVSALLTYAGALTIAAFTEEVKEEFKCILYCNSAEDTPGVVTFDFGAVVSEVQNRSGIADIWNVLEIYLNILNAYQGGGEGLNRAGATTAITSAECDCPDCPELWCRSWGFGVDTAGWTVVYGRHNAGGITSNTSGTDNVGFYYASWNTPAYVRTVTFHFNQAWEGHSPRIIVYSPFETTPLTDAIRLGNGGTEVTITLNRSIYRIGFNLDRSTEPGASAGYWGAIRLTALTIRGEGDNPFGEDNCE